MSDDGGGRASAEDGGGTVLPQKKGARPAKDDRGAVCRGRTVRLSTTVERPTPLRSATDEGGACPVGRVAASLGDGRGRPREAVAATLLPPEEGGRKAAITSLGDGRGERAWPPREVSAVALLPREAGVRQDGGDGATVKEKRSADAVMGGFVWPWTDAHLRTHPTFTPQAQFS